MPFTGPSSSSPSGTLKQVLKIFSEKYPPRTTIEAQAAYFETKVFNRHIQKNSA